MPSSRASFSPDGNPRPGVGAHTTEQIGLLIDRFRLVEKLRLMHWQRITLGSFGAMACISYNLWHKPLTPWLSPEGGEVLGVLYLLIGATLLWIRFTTCERQVHATVATPRERTLLIAEVSGRYGNAWLAWAAAGHILICLATFLRLHFSLGSTSLPLWLALTPTWGLLAYGFFHAPTRARLLQLHETT